MRKNHFYSIVGTWQVSCSRVEMKTDEIQMDIAHTAFVFGFDSNMDNIRYVRVI